MRRIVWLAVLVLVSAACARDDPTAGGASPGARAKAEPVACTGSGIKTVERGTLTVGSDIAFAPFESVNQQTQQPEGFDIDLLSEIAKRNQLKAEFVNQTFSGIIAGLIAKKFDVIASAMTINAERRAQICFSDPYFDSNQSLMVNAKRTPDIEGVDDLTGKTVGVQSGTTGEGWANEHLKGKARTIKAYETADDAFLDLKSGKIDGFVNDIPVNLFKQKSDPDLKVVDEMKTDERYSIAVHPQNKGLLDAINEALGEIRSDGTYGTIYEKWFGTKPGVSP